MDLRFSCPNCSQPLTVDETAGGQFIVCPACASEVQVPSKGTRTVPKDSSGATPPPFSGASGPPPFEGTSPKSERAPEENIDPIPELHPAMEDPDYAPQVEDSPHGFSAGFLSGMLDRRLMVLKTKNIGAAYDATAKKLKMLGDMALLAIVAGWLGMNVYNNYSSAGTEEKTGDPKKEAEAKVEEDPKAKEKAAAADIFAKVIEPALKTTCYDCHGADSQKSKLNLSIRDKAGEVDGILAMIDIGKPPAESNLLKRISAKDDEVMPPAAWDDKAKKLDETKVLKKEVVDALNKWIIAGAPGPALAMAGDTDAQKKPTISTKTLIAIGKALLTGLLAVFLVFIIHYLTGRFFDANDSVIAASTPSRISSATVPNALAVLFWICSVGILIAAFIKSGTMALEDIKANWLAALINLLLGGLLFAFSLALARLFVADDFLNIKASGDANAGDEALGVFSMFIKVGLKMAPVYYGLSLALGCLFYLLDTFWPSKELAMNALLFGGYIETIVHGPGISLKNVGIDLTIPNIVVLPIKAYFYFLAAFLVVEVARAVLNISRRLGAK